MTQSFKLLGNSAISSGIQKIFAVRWSFKSMAEFTASAVDKKNCSEATRRQAATIVLCCVLCCYRNRAGATEGGNEKMAAVDLRKRGVNLREAVFTEFRRVRTLPNVFGQGNGPGFDISALVREYIPVGTSFRDAEIILRAADFGVSPSPPRPNLSPVSELTRFKILSGNMMERGAFVMYELFIELDPEIPGSPSTAVKAVHARFLYSAL